MNLAEQLQVEEGSIDSLGEIVEPLLNWFQQNARQMPWRDHPTPYYVWVSEVMLQQTRVEAVREYFARFIQTYPTIEDLSAAKEDELLKVWEGLGYYNRVRNLKKGAQKVVQEFNGMLPPDYDALKTIPGIGDYTAGAIASLAYGLPTPAVDGNVYRVISRYLGSYANVSTGPVQKSYLSLIARIIPAEYPAAFNQSLMELGALICRPNGIPLCNQCPLEISCTTAHQDWALDLPVKNIPKSRKIEKRTILILCADNQILLSKRPEKGLLANLWQPINLKGSLKKDEILIYTDELGTQIRKITALPKGKHIFSHIEWQMSGWLIECSPFHPPKEHEWVSSLEHHSLPSAFSIYRQTIEDQFLQTSTEYR